MTKCLLSLVIALCCRAALFAQKPAADPGMVLAEAQRKMDSIMHDPKFKQWTNKGAPNMTQPAANPAAMLAGPRKPDTAFFSELQMPPRNETGLASIPSQPMNKTQLVRFVKDLRTKIFAAMPGGIGRGPLAMTGYDAESLDKGGVLAWCSGNTDLALELALDAADANPDDDNILDNLAAILTMCNLPVEAVPILDFVKQGDPGNSTINNNLGQAYYLLGDAAKAKAYLQAAIAACADHPQANFTLACMAYIQGNKSQAIAYCENSIRGAFMVDSWTMLKACKPDARLMDLIRHRYKATDYFSPHKYPLLPQCKEVADVKTLQEQYKEYEAMLQQMEKRYQQIVKTEADYVRKNEANEVMAKIAQRKNPLRPFGALAQTVIGDITEDFGDRIKRLNAYDSTYFHKIATLKQEHDDECAALVKRLEKRGDAAGEGNPDMNLESDECKALNAVHNNYLPELAKLTEERQREWINQLKNYYNDYAYWCYLASIDDHSYRQMFYTNVIAWIDLILKLNHTHLYSCKLPVTYGGNEADSLEIAEGKCPLTAKIDAGLNKNVDGEKKFEKFASFDINCEDYKVAFSLPEGASLIVKQSAAGATTVAFEAGLTGKDSKSKVVKLLPIGASMGNSITFGGAQPVDIAWHWEFELNLPGYLGGKNSVGWGFGTNSGLEFHGKGRLVARGSALADKYLFNQKPPDQQQNKHVKLYDDIPKRH
jgi:tetratricopeptide (TPR) repeat protein